MPSPGVFVDRPASNCKQLTESGLLRLGAPLGIASAKCFVCMLHQFWSNDAPCGLGSSQTRPPAGPRRRGPSSQLGPLERVRRTARSLPENNRACFCAYLGPIWKSTPLPAKITVVEQKLNRFCILAEQESLSKYSKTSKTQRLRQIGAGRAGGWKRQQIV